MFGLDDIIEGIGDAIGDIGGVFDFITPGVGSLIGGVASAAGQFFGGQNQNHMQIQAANQQMAFQEYMSSTAHQREVADLRSAGLNPILSARLGGASSPGGAMPNIGNPLGAAATTLASSAQGAAQLAQQQDLIKSQVTATNAQALKTAAETQTIDAVREPTKNLIGAQWATTDTQGVLNRALTRQSNENLKKIQQEITNLVTQNMMTTYGLSSAAAEAKAGELNQRYYDHPVGKFFHYLGQGARDVNPFLSGANSARSFTGQ